MTTYQKATLGLLAAAIVVGAFTLNGRPAIVNAVPAAAVTNPAGNGAGIQTSGEATIKVKPDIAVLSLGMTAGSASAADAQGQVAQRVANVLKAAKDLGIADKDVKTYGYNLYPSYQNSYPKISGYTASEQISFTLRDVTKVGKALDSLAGDAGATNASLQFALDDRKPAEAEARAQAIAEARAKADAMAKAGGVRVGQLLSVTDQASGYLGPTIYGASTATSGKDTVVPVGDLDVVIRVQVQYAIA
jgi:uncharacterized protein